MHSAETAMKVRHRTFVNRLSPEPEFPWQKAVLDYFEDAALKYLVVADRFTGWPELSRQNGKALTYWSKPAATCLPSSGYLKSCHLMGDLLSMDMNGNDS